MPRATANGIEIEYEQFGDQGCPPVVLIMGLAAQMILWPDEFCEQLAARGFRVTRFDNRDVGRSTWLKDAEVPDLGALMMASMTGSPVEAPYTLGDMAADTVGLLDALGLADAHVVGASMGGMIAQTMAIEHPRRLRTLTSIMSTTGNPALPQPAPEIVQALLTPVGSGREENIERVVELFRTIGSPGFEFDEAGTRDVATRAFDRGFHPAGVIRQIAAIAASGNRRPLLASVRMPTVVIHGRADPLVPFEGGVDTAEAIEGARLVGIEGMGHDLPRAVWPTIVDEVVRLAADG